MLFRSEEKRDDGQEDPLPILPLDSKNNFTIPVDRPKVRRSARINKLSKKKK